MGFLDKLKPQPRWKHADPAIRLESLRDLDDPLELAVLAESDPDVRVRRAVVARIADPAVLGRVASGDTDPDLRERAADQLLGLASRRPDPDAAGDEHAVVALAAVRAIEDPRRLSTIAKSEATEAVRADALGRLSDERALSSIARHAKHEATALAALARLSDPADLLEVALNADHRDVALGAFDRAIAPGRDLAQLRSVEARTQQKAVAKRARALIQEIEDAEAARRAAEEERRRREAALIEAVGRLVDVADVAVARAELVRLTESWRGLSVMEQSTLDRFTDATAAAQENIVMRQREADEAIERARQRAEAIATRDALCARVETLGGDDALEQLVPIEEEWRSLLPLVGNGPEADRLAERFALAVAACRKRHELGAKLAETRASLDALVVEAEGLLSHDDAAAAATRWQALSREARGLTAVLHEAGALPDRAAEAAPDASVSPLDRLAAVGESFAARDAARDQAAAKVRQDVAGQLTRLTERTRRVVEAETVTLREGERLMRDIKMGLDAAMAHGSAREIDEAAAKLRTAQEQVAPRVRELREMDDWRRFANAQQQEQLIALAEAIVASLKQEEETGKPSDLAATARALRELHAKWHEVAEAPRQSAQRLWDRFRSATDFIRSRCEAYFAQLREARTASLERRAALVVEAEGLAVSTDWGKAAARFQELQTEWQQLGPAGRESGRDLAQRFRTASNTFFARRREDLTDRKKTWTENLAKKEALCARAEELVESTDWDAASSEIKRLQADWKTIGPVRRNKSEAIWNRFRTAADQFFERYHHRHEIALSSKLAEREALVVELESLVATEGLDTADLSARVQALRTTWNRSVPIPGGGIKPLADRWQTALAAAVLRQPDAFKGTDLDPTAVVQKMEKILARVEALVSSIPEARGGTSATELLAARLRSALASNAMGGRGGEEVKWRAAADTVKEAQTAWQRLAPVSAPETRALESRFREACRRVMDQARLHSGSGSGGGAPRRPPSRPTAAAAV